LAFEPRTQIQDTHILVPGAATVMQSVINQRLESHISLFHIHSKAKK